jgi:hypothetical protein
MEKLEARSWKRKKKNNVKRKQLFSTFIDETLQAPCFSKGFVRNCPCIGLCTGH